MLTPGLIQSSQVMWEGMHLAGSDSVRRMHIDPFLTPVSMKERSKAFSLADVDKRSPEKKNCYTGWGVFLNDCAGVIPKPSSEGHFLTGRSCFPKHFVQRRQKLDLEKLNVRSNTASLVQKPSSLSSGLVFESTASLLQS